VEDFSPAAGDSLFPFLLFLCFPLLKHESPYQKNEVFHFSEEETP